MSLPLRHGSATALLSIQEIRQLHADMFRALRDEARAIQQEGVRPDLLLPAGERRSQRGAFHEYEFHLAAPARVRAGQDVQCTFGDLRLASTVVTADGRDLVLALPRDIGARIAEGGTLSTDTTWLIGALQQRLSESILSLTRRRRCSPPFSFEPALRTIGAGSFTPAERLPHPVVLSASPRPNTEQARAIRLAFGSDTCFLFGPPGTGKTHTLARIIEAHVRAGRSVLALAPSNTAVDVLMRAVVERLRDAEGLSEGAVLRFGPRPSPWFRDALGARVLHDQVIERIRATRYAPAIERVQALVTKHEEELLGAERALVGCSAPGPCPPAHLIRRLQGTCSRARIRLSRARDNLRRLRRSSALLPRALIERCVVLGTTVHQTYISRELRRQFDVVAIDEASMVQPVQVYIAAGLARTPHGRVVIAGDFRQLPSVVAAHTRLAREWLGTDSFHLVGIPDDLARDDPPRYVAMLTTQHRMSPGICSLVSDLAYGGLLRTDPSVASRRRLPAPLATTDVFYIDSTPLRPLARQLRGGTRVNLAHVEIVEHLLAELDSAGAISPSGAWSVAVLAPFVGQVRAIQERLGQRYRGRGVHVTTTHRSQGGEAEIVIFDLTDAPGLAISPFLGANHLSETGARLINVSLSRAKQQLYVIGPMPYLRRCGGAVARGLVDHLAEEAVQVKLNDFWGACLQVYGSSD